MKSVAILGLTMALGGAGCASTNGAAVTAERGWSGAPWHDGPSIQVGAARVMDTIVNPLAPIGLASRDGAITLSYGRRGHLRSIARIDAESLRPLSQPEGVASLQPSEAADDSTAPRTSPARVVLEGGHFILVWKRGDAESGYRALAQEFAGNGTSVAPPAVISPSDIDVMGSPQAVTTDGRHVVVSFAAGGENGFELITVSIQAGSQSTTNASPPNQILDHSMRLP